MLYHIYLREEETSHPRGRTKLQEKFPGTWRKFGASALFKALFSGVPRQTQKGVVKDELCAGKIAGF